MFVYSYLYIVKNIQFMNSKSSMAEARVVAWLKPKPLLSMEPQHIGYCWKALVIGRMINALL